MKIDLDNLPKGVFAMQDGDAYRFMIQGESQTVLAFVKGGEIDLVPDRDVGHKRLAEALSQ